MAEDDGFLTRTPEQWVEQCGPDFDGTVMLRLVLRDRCYGASVLGMCGALTADEVERLEQVAGGVEELPGISRRDALHILQGRLVVIDPMRWICEEA